MLTPRRADAGVGGEPGAVGRGSWPRRASAARTGREAAGRSGAKESVLATAIEAVLGVVYLEGGLPAAAAFRGRAGRVVTSDACRIGRSRRREPAAVAAVPPGSLRLSSRRPCGGSMQDLFAARERQAQGYTLSWSGDAAAAARARRCSSSRRASSPTATRPSSGATRAARGCARCRSPPWGSAPGSASTCALFVLTLLSTLAAGCFFASGSIPFVTFNPLRAPAPAARRHPVRRHAARHPGHARVRPLLHREGLRRLGEPAVLHPRAAAGLPVRHPRRGDPDALARARPQLALRHRGGGAAGGADRGHPRAARSGCAGRTSSAVPPGRRA